MINIEGIGILAFPRAIELDPGEFQRVMLVNTYAPLRVAGHLWSKWQQELRAVIGAIGHWGQRWARVNRDDDLDPGWLVWAMHRRLDTQAMPPGVQSSR